MSLHRARIVAAVLLLFGAMVHPRLHGQEPRQPVLILVSSATGGEDISMGLLKNAYESQPTEFRGVRLIPFNLPVGQSARAVVDRVMLGLAPDRVGAFWIDQKIRSGTSAPRTIASPEMLLRVVASLRGAISYAEMNPTAVPAGIIALRIDGKRPTDSDYPFAGR